MTARGGDPRRSRRASRALALLALLCLFLAPGGRGSTRAGSADAAPPALRVVRSRSAAAPAATVHNLTVAGSHSYAVGPARAWVHNTKLPRDIAEFLSSPGEKILDVGAGNGLMTMKLAEAHPGATVLGIDTDAALVELTAPIVSHRTGGAARSVVFDARRLPDASADAVYLFHPHPFDAVEMFEQSLRVTRSGGTLTVALDAQAAERALPQILESAPAYGVPASAIRTFDTLDAAIRAAPAYGVAPPTHWHESFGRLLVIEKP